MSENNDVARIAVYMTQAQLDQVKAKAQELGMQPSTYMRFLVLQDLRAEKAQQNG